MISTTNDYTSMTSGGMVCDDACQTINLKDGQKVTEVYVTKDQQVKAGDKLLAYDVTSLSLSVEMKQLEDVYKRQKLKRFQKRLSMIAGPKAAPKIPHALETSAMIEPALGFEAMMSAATAIPRTTIRPVHIISLSLALPFLMTGLYTSLENADEAASSWLSAVLMEAASTAERSIPEITPGKIFLTIWMKTREFSLIDSSKPRKSLPITPIKVAKNTISKMCIRDRC